MNGVLTSEREQRGNGTGQRAPNPSGLPIRRRWGRLAAGAALVVVWVWGTAAAVMSAGDRSDVVVVADAVGRYEPIELSDLRVARIGVDRQTETISGTELDSLVGRLAATELVKGSVLSPHQLVPRGERVVGQGEALVGARLKPSELPSEGVSAGATVLVVSRPAATGQGDVTQVAGWLLGLGEADPSTGQRSAALVVPEADAPRVTAAAADGRVSLVVLEG